MNQGLSAQHNQRPIIGLFGGTFDPIHIGHLRMALELKQRLGLDQMRLLPCHIPPHRQAPHADTEHRAAMVQLAISGCDELMWDDLELQNPEPSYSIHTLQHLRARLGTEVALCLAMGMDSLVTLQTWYCWQDLLQLAHIIVAARPGWQLPEAGEMAEWVRTHRGQAADLRLAPRGKIVIEELTLLPISSTAIRALIQQRQSPQFLVPDSVWHYIRDHHLYQTVANAAAHENNA